MELLTMDSSVNELSTKELLTMDSSVSDYPPRNYPSWIPQ
jgi:hypothetical protein